MKKQTYEIFTDKNELKIAELIQQRRLQILVHSCLYYELNTNLISDKIWDGWAKELAQLQVKYPVIASKVIWADAFKDWDGTTGAFLPLKDAWVVQKAYRVMFLNRAACAVSYKPVDAHPRSKSGIKRLF